MQVFWFSFPIRSVSVKGEKLVFLKQFITARFHIISSRAEKVYVLCYGLHEILAPVYGSYRHMPNCRPVFTFQRINYIKVK